MSEFKRMIQDIVDGFDEENPNGITLYHGALYIEEFPIENYNVGDLGDGFYLTPYKKDAEFYCRMKYKKAKEKGEEYFYDKLPIINVYFLSKEFLDIADKLFIESNSELYRQFALNKINEKNGTYKSNEDITFSDQTLLNHQKVLNNMLRTDIAPKEKLDILKNCVYNKDFGPSLQMALRQPLLDCLEFIEFYELDDC